MVLPLGNGFTLPEKGEKCLLVGGGIGIAPLLAANAVCFFVAAAMETRISTDEKYIETQKLTAIEGAGKGRQMLADMKEGFRYLTGEKGLLAVTLYFAVIFSWYI